MQTEPERELGEMHIKIVHLCLDWIFIISSCQKAKDEGLAGGGGFRCMLAGTQDTLGKCTHGLSTL